MELVIPASRATCTGRVEFTAYTATGLDSGSVVIPVGIQDHEEPFVEVALTKSFELALFRNASYTFPWATAILSRSGESLLASDKVAKQTIAHSTPELMIAFT